MIEMGPAEKRVRQKHRRFRTWPLQRGDARVSPDGYIHGCRVCDYPWPCDVLLALDELRGEAKP